MEPVLYTVVDGVATITLNKPESLNAMSMDLVNGVIDSLFDAEKDPAVRVIILTGTGRAFSAGGDLNSLDGLSTDDEREFFIAEVGRMVHTIYYLRKPVIAKVNGVAAGAGFNLALACDFIYAVDTAKFVQSFVNVGLSPDCGGFYLLSQAVGLHKAKELMLLAVPVTAAEGERLGFVNGIFTADELDAKVEELAGVLKAKAPLAIKYTKEGLNEFGDALDIALEYESKTSAQLLGTADFQEGVAAFKEKRQADFKGE